jgi:hypothetical protein
MKDDLTHFSVARRPDAAESRIRLSRRGALTFGVFGLAALLPACGGGSGSADLSSSAGPTGGGVASPAEAAAWNVGPLYFAAGSGATLDLAATLPNGVTKGGAFGTSSEGTSLPAGMTLSPAGILSIGTAPIGDVVGVVFTYTEPA